MKIAVCVKQVAALGDEVEFTDDERDVDPDYLDRSINEWDTYGVEEALRVRDAAGGGEVVALTVGAAHTEETLRRCLAMGVDRAVRIEVDREHGDAIDPLTVARALADVIEGEQPDLVVTGVQSSDAVQAATGSMLAELLGLPAVAVVIKLVYEPGSASARVHRELEGGLVDVVDVNVPCVLTIQSGINEPRYATLRAIKQASQQEISVRSFSAAGEPCYRVRRMFSPPKGEGAEMLGDDAAEVARRINEIVRGRLA